MPQNNGSWIEPQIIAAELRIQEACLRHLAESRSDMPPAVNGWLEQIAEIARALSDYADGYRPASKPEESIAVMDDGQHPPVLPFRGRQDGEPVLIR